MMVNRSPLKREHNQTIETENMRFWNKLYKIKATINGDDQAGSFREHSRLSNMLQKFKKNKKGFTVTKSSSFLEKRIKMEPIHQKL
jgi:hypothetical protein